MNEWTLLVDSSGPTMKLVKAVIMDRECISIFLDICDLICAVIYPVLLISCAPPLMNSYCFSLALLCDASWNSLQYHELLSGASGGWFIGGVACCSCSTLDPKRHNRAARQKKQATSSQYF